eukprot:94355-Rhodomonas_salina.1
MAGPYRHYEACSQVLKLPPAINRIHPAVQYKRYPECCRVHLIAFALPPTAGTRAPYASAWKDRHKRALRKVRVRHAVLISGSFLCGVQY